MTPTRPRLDLVAEHLAFSLLPVALEIILPTPWDSGFHSPRLGGMPLPSCP